MIRHRSHHVRHCYPSSKKGGGWATQLKRLFFEEGQLGNPTQAPLLRRTAGRPSQASLLRRRTAAQPTQAPLRRRAAGRPTRAALLRRSAPIPALSRSFFEEGRPAGPRATSLSNAKRWRADFWPADVVAGFDHFNTRSLRAIRRSPSGAAHKGAAPDGDLRIAGGEPQPEALSSILKNPDVHARRCATTSI